MDNNKNLPIGVFDSGVGGLTVVKEIMQMLPNEKIVYFADSARIPYGSKSKETIIKYSKQIAGFLKTKNVKAIVIACNTASAFAYEDLRREFDIPVIGVVRPGAVAAAKETRNGKVGIIGTVGTIESGYYDVNVKEVRPGTQVFGKACPLFVPLVEEGMATDSVTVTMAKRYLEYLMEQNIDTLILGCTHYPLLRETIKGVVGDNVKLVNPAYETVKKLKELLEIKHLLKDEDCNPEHEFFVSDGPEKFNESAKKILELTIHSTKKVDVDTY